MGEAQVEKLRGGGQIQQAGAGQLPVAAANTAPVVAALPVANPAVVAVAVAGDDAASRLWKLNGLKTQGLVTEEEYQQKRADIIATV